MLAKATAPTPEPVSRAWPAPTKITRVLDNDLLMPTISLPRPRQPA